MRLRIAIAVVGLFAVGLAGCAPAESDAPGPEVEVLARSSFPDPVSASLQLTVGGRELQIDVDDPSDVVVAELTFGPGASAGWHTHPGPVIVSVASGALTIVNATDCSEHVYAAGQAFIDPGHGNVHLGYNASETEDAVVYATFLEVPEGSGPTIPVTDPGC